MGGFFRKGAAVSDARPPAPPRPDRQALGTCARCGLAVMLGEGLDANVRAPRASGGPDAALVHFVCDAEIRGSVERKVEAMRALHRAIAALTNLPDVRASLEHEVAQLPDAIQVGDAVTALERARTLVECTAMERPERRRLALSYLDAMLRKLAA
jgi:hypothetical protein